MRIVFLDIDGVLNHWDHLTTDECQNSTDMSGSGYLDPECVQRLNTLIERTDAKVVVSSTWRMNHTIDSLQQTLEEKGFEGEIIDFTTTEDLGTRGDQIWDWLKCPEEVESFVILDDDADAAKPFLGAHYVGTSLAKGGLQDEHVDMAVRILEEETLDV